MADSNHLVAGSVDNIIIINLIKNRFELNYETNLNYTVTTVSNFDYSVHLKDLEC